MTAEPRVDCWLGEFTSHSVILGASPETPQQAWRRTGRPRELMKSSLITGGRMRRRCGPRSYYAFAATNCFSGSELALRRDLSGTNCSPQPPPELSSEDLLGTHGEDRGRDCKMHADGRAGN